MTVGPVTRVVNIRSESYDVYCGRAGQGFDGTFGNPFPPQHKADRYQSIMRFRAYFLERVQSDLDFRRRVLALRGKRLGCFCAPYGGLTGNDALVCHAQIIAWWLDSEGTAVAA